MNLFGREIRSNSKTRTTFTSDDAAFAKALGIDIDGISADKAKEATFYTCLRILSDAVSKLPLKLHQSSDEGTTKENKHYLYNLLKLRPNPIMSSSTFWKTVEFQRNYFGHAIVAIDYHKFGKDAGKVKSLIPLDMSTVDIWIDDRGILGSENNAIYYIYIDQRGHQYKFKNSEVLHFIGMTKDGMQGMAIKDYLKTLVENAQASTSYTNNYWKNGLHSKGIIKYIGDLDEGKQKQLQEKMSRISGGIANSGKIMPLPIGFDYQSISTSMADAQFTELSQLNITQIASAFGVKMHQLGSLERSTNSNIEHQNKEFYVDTLQPILTNYEQELTYKLLTSNEVSSGYFFRFNVDSILRSNTKERAEYLTTFVEKGVMTPAEARKQIDLPHLDGSDQLIVNGSYLSLEDAVNGANYDRTGLEGGENE
ncbi:HK97 family phage portal protein [Virgibacillus natechei]|uniref:HK97 family phage portal protein n=1 Tax=Virgibacillus natechei TaxID=1216297 RepID=A0ABS4IAM6_9BACI|nr:phage portal protein [Virgibacillus natechei]MBP1967983.1 HK97 family phage portal protein [Virgibacillus natechei]UZD14731.1 phage portal protein [Virgibacillus natechei]